MHGLVSQTSKVRECTVTVHVHVGLARGRTGSMRFTIKCVRACIHVRLAF